MGSKKLETCLEYEMDIKTLWLKAINTVCESDQYVTVCTCSYRIFLKEIESHCQELKANK